MTKHIVVRTRTFLSLPFDTKIVPIYFTAQHFFLFKLENFTFCYFVTYTQTVAVYRRGIISLPHTVNKILRNFYLVFEKPKTLDNWASFETNAFDLNLLHILVLYSSRSITRLKNYCSICNSKSIVPLQSLKRWRNFNIFRDYSAAPSLIATKWSALIFSDGWWIHRISIFYKAVKGT